LRASSISDCAQGNDFEQIVACGEPIRREQVRGREVTRTSETILTELAWTSRTLDVLNVQKWSQKDGF
jgi:hypothetical protein